jgi:hypothetical protein
MDAIMETYLESHGKSRPEAGGGSPPARRGSVRLSMVALLAVLAAAGASAQSLPPAPKPAQVQAAIDGGLEWLAANQVREGPLAGGWEGPSYHTTAASMAGLAFLANGYRPGVGEYGQVIDRAMGFVQDSMSADGYLGAKEQQMYVHAICTLFGLSYLGTTENPAAERELADWCRKSLELIVRAQKVRKPPQERGGWRYSPSSQASDLSVTSWMLLVLHAARQCGFEIDQRAVDAGINYVNRAYREESRVIRDANGKAVATKELRGYLYRQGASVEPERGATGAAVFIKGLIEGGLDERSESVVPLLTELPPTWEGEWHNGYFFFTAFYLTQGMFQIGGREWERFAAQIKAELVTHQDGDGKWPFPVTNREQSRDAGYAYSTGTSVLILSLEKQYLPMYQRQRPLF